MTKLLPSFILVGLMGLTKGFLFDMDLNLHAGLEKGNQIPVGSGSYLRDSFRKNVLVPGFLSCEGRTEVQQKIRYDHRKSFSRGNFGFNDWNWGINTQIEEPTKRYYHFEKQRGSLKCM